MVSIASGYAAHESWIFALSKSNLQIAAVRLLLLVATIDEYVCSNDVMWFYMIGIGRFRG
jgi:hypothetical protein